MGSTGLRLFMLPFLGGGGGGKGGRRDKINTLCHTHLPKDLVYSSLASCEIMNMKLASPKLLTADVVTNI